MVSGTESINNGELFLDSFSITPTKLSNETWTPLRPSTAENTPTIIPTIKATSTSTPTILPDEHIIRNIIGYRQAYAISCESRSAADWANYFGVEAYESNIQFALPRSDNPDLGFVGDVHDPWGQVPPYSYGVHAGPIAEVLREEYNLPARAEKNFSLEELKQEIANEQPVIAWVIGNVVGGVPAEYTDKEGNTTIVAAYEHTIIVTGYRENKIRYLNNSRFYEVPVDVFLNSWGVLGNMVVFYDEKIFD